MALPVPANVPVKITKVLRLRGLASSLKLFDLLCY